MKFTSPSHFSYPALSVAMESLPECTIECIKFFIDEQRSSIFFICSHSLYIAAKKKAEAPTKRTRETGGKLILIDEAQYHQLAYMEHQRPLIIATGGALRCSIAAA
jgi:hypothetical protein